MSRSEIISRINTKFSQWAVQLELYSAANMHDMAILSEPVAALFLNRMFNWQLVNANLADLNRDGIDLVDDQNRIFVQVTSSRLGVVKVRKTFKSDILVKYNQGYRVIIFSMVHETPLWAQKKQVVQLENEEQVIFEPRENYLDFKTLFAELAGSQEFSEDDLEDLLDILLSVADSNDLAKDPLVIEQIIAELAKTSITVTRKLNKDKQEFKIIDKIKFNELQKLSTYILDKSGKQDIFDDIYRTYRQNGVQADDIVFELLAQAYLFDPKISATEDPVQKFGKLIAYVNTYLEDNNTGFFTKINKDFGLDTVGLYIPYVIVDAFDRCKIFEQPV